MKGGTAGIAIRGLTAWQPTHSVRHEQLTPLRKPYRCDIIRFVCRKEFVAGQLVISDRYRQVY